MGLKELIIQQREQILALARRHARNVRVFGAMVRDEVGPDSDATFLILGALLMDVQDLLGERSIS